MIRHFFEMASGHSITITTADIKANYIKISPVTRRKENRETSLPMKVKNFRLIIGLRSSKFYYSNRMLCGNVHFSHISAAEMYAYQ